MRLSATPRKTRAARSGNLTPMNQPDPIRARASVLLDLVENANRTLAFPVFDGPALADVLAWIVDGSSALSRQRSPVAHDARRDLFKLYVSAGQPVSYLCPSLSATAQSEPASDPQTEATLAPPSPPAPASGQGIPSSMPANI